MHLYIVYISRNTKNVESSHILYHSMVFDNYIRITGTCLSQIA